LSRYTALDAARPASMEDEHFYCESCNGELAAESDKLAAEGSEDGDDNVRHRCCEKLKEMLWKMKVCKFFMSKLHYLVRACYRFFVVDINVKCFLPTYIFSKFYW